MLVLEKFREKVANSPLKHGESELAVTVSVGLATSLVDGDDVKVLFERADQSLYSCKNHGRNQVRHYAAGSMIAYQEVGLADQIKEAYLANNASVD